MHTGPVILYDYWRSSAAYRVRIALASLGIDHERVPVDLLKREHTSAEHRERNPQGLVPVLLIDGRMLTQSLAIIEYLDETRENAGFLPRDAAGRARVRTLSHAIAMEIHPVCNLRVATHAMALGGGDEAVRQTWMQKFIGEGLAAFEALLDRPETGTFCHGDAPTMADVCLVPQVYNARRWGVDLAACPRVARIASRCDTLPAFQSAHPDAVAPG